MREGGRIGFERVDWFNSGLFDDDSALPLSRDDIALVREAAARDWAEIDPSIFGTLFERGSTLTSAVSWAHITPTATRSC